MDRLVKFILNTNLLNFPSYFSLHVILNSKFIAIYLPSSLSLIICCNAILLFNYLLSPQLHYISEVQECPCKLLFRPRLSLKSIYELGNCASLTL